MFNGNLQRLREEAGLSQKELAEKLHVVRQTVSKWEKGLSVPDADMLLQIAEVFGVTPNELLDVDEVSSLDTEEITWRTTAISEQIRAASQRLDNALGYIKRAALCLVILALFPVVFASCNQTPSSYGFTTIIYELDGQERDFSIQHPGNDPSTATSCNGDADLVRELHPQDYLEGADSAYKIERLVTDEIESRGGKIVSVDTSVES